MGFIILLAALAALLVLVAIVWLIGAREPVYRIVKGAGWFVAVRGGDARPALSPDVNITWSARADFPFIGGRDNYWSRFYVLDGRDSAHAPIDLSNAEDAYIARVAFGAPPKLALGVLRILVTLGILAKPRGAISADVHAKGYRAELMPDRAGAAQLLAQPAAYAPSMVNFLSYLPSARYDEGPVRSGRAAYGAYATVAMRTVYRTGGHLLFYGRIGEVLRQASNGPTTGAWSDVAAMHYPNPAAILSMEHARAYIRALHHRDAGLERTVVIASTDDRRLTS